MRPTHWDSPYTVHLSSVQFFSASWNKNSDYAPFSLVGTKADTTIWDQKKWKLHILQHASTNCISFLSCQQRQTSWRDNYSFCFFGVYVTCFKCIWTFAFTATMIDLITLQGFSTSIYRLWSYRNRILFSRPRLLLVNISIPRRDVLAHSSLFRDRDETSRLTLWRCKDTVYLEL